MTVIAFLEKSVFVDFNDVLEEYSRRQGELLDVLRQFRAEYGEAVSGPSQPPPLSPFQGSPSVTAHRPAAPSVRRPIVPSPPPPERPARGQRTWGDERSEERR